MRTIHAISQIVLLEMIRRKDVYVLLFLTALFTLLAGSVNFFNEDRIVRYLKEICLLLIWVSALVLAVAMTARQIPAEKESRTLYPLLAKPVTRAQFVLGKFLGCWLASGAALVLFYGFFWAVGAARADSLPPGQLWQAALLHWAMLAIVISAVLLGSLVFAAPSSNLTISLVCAGGILFLGRHLNKVALQQTEPLQSVLYGIYYVIPHLEWFDLRALLVHNWEPVPLGVTLVALLYAAAYSALFLSLACWKFRRTLLD